MAYIFLDESGQFGKQDHEKYFVIASFTVGNPRRTEKSFRVWHQSRFPRKFRGQPEIKFSEVNVDDKLKLKTLRFISRLDVRIRFLYLERKNIPLSYWKKDGLESGLLYTNIIGELLEAYLPTDEKEFRIFCDQRHLKRISRAEFKKALKSRLLPKLQKGTLVQIEMIDSTSNANIQIVDWIAGALAHYLENKTLGKEYYEILKNNILDGKGIEVFKEGN